MTRIVLGAAEPGWPRPWCMYKPDDRGGEPRLVPVPWINGDKAARLGDWLAFHSDADRAHTERLCAVCGDPLNRTVILGAYASQKATSGPGGHPRCMWLAINVCPHFEGRNDDEPVAWLYRGDGVGYIVANGLDSPYESEPNDVDVAAEPLTCEALRILAKADPKGDGE